MKRFATPIILTIVLSVVLVALFMNVDLTPAAASSQGRSIDAVMRALFALSAIIFSLVVSFLFYSLVAFRRKPGDQEDATPFHGHLALEVVWTVVPLIIVLVLGGYGASTLLDITRRPPGEELVVEVTGSQFAWSFDYPDLDCSSMELVLPVNRPALFRISSTDVIHSFWVPEFRIKTDALPGVLNETRITPTQVGDYTAYCTELCGTHHAYMTAPVRVVDEADFQQWVRQQHEAARIAGAIVEEGRGYAKQFGCLGCHSTDGSALAGPTFQGLFASRRDFEDGTAAVADEEYLRNAIINPADRIVQGFPSIMPTNYQNRLTEEQIQLIIEFTKSLE